MTKTLCENCFQRYLNATEILTKFNLNIFSHLFAHRLKGLWNSEANVKST